MCDNCLGLAQLAKYRKKSWWGPGPEERPPLAHRPLKRPIRYVYILKLSDNSFYVGQTTDLAIRIREHNDGVQRQTKDKSPRLVHYEQFEGAREAVSAREDELTKLNQTPARRRRLRVMIERFREPLRLLDLEA